MIMPRSQLLKPCYDFRVLSMTTVFIFLFAWYESNQFLSTRSGRAVTMLSAQGHSWATRFWHWLIICIGRCLVFFFILFFRISGQNFWGIDMSFFSSSLLQRLFWKPCGNCLKHTSFFISIGGGAHQHIASHVTYPTIRPFLDLMRSRSSPKNIYLTKCPNTRLFSPMYVQLWNLRFCETHSTNFNSQSSPTHRDPCPRQVCFK